MATDRIEVSYKVVTPMFCGGARPTVAELRLPSFKGVLRWWWRAFAWPRSGGALSKVAAAEDELFGSARRGQGRVIMRLVTPIAPTTIKKDEVLKVEGKVVGEGARYLGYGVMEAFARKAKENRPAVEAGQLTRACLRAPFEIKLELRVRDLDEATRGSLVDALKAVGLLGGIGAKSRKGYGSLVLASMALNGKPCWSLPTSPHDLQRAIQGLIGSARNATDHPGGLPPYTALSSRTRVVLALGNGQIQPLTLLDRVGREMMRFRSWGHNGKVLGTDSERNFKHDHDLMRKPPGQRSTHPRRIVFGLPHNYGKQPVQQVGPADDHLDRRASPLLIHIHECGNTPVAVLSLFPAEFLPGGDEALVDVGGKKLKLAPDQELWKPANDFLDRLLDAEKRKEPFGPAIEVRP
jgi:CRISPR-associated protein Cmr1